MTSPEFGIAAFHFYPICTAAKCRASLFGLLPGSHAIVKKDSSGLFAFCLFSSNGQQQTTTKPQNHKNHHSLIIICCHLTSLL
jgi:hypothetical protein